MKSIVSVSTALVLASGLVAQRTAPSQEKLIHKRDEELAAEWVKMAPWVTDYDEAKAKSKETGKPIFAYFSRSFAF